MRTLDQEISVYVPAISLAKLFTRNTQTILRSVFFLSTIVSIILSIFGDLLLSHVPVQLWWGTSLIFGALWVEQILIYAYHNSFYFRGLQSIIHDEPMPGKVTYDLAEVVLRQPNDVTRAFCESLIGTNVLIRCGILPNAVNEFLNTPRQKLTTEMILLPEDEMFSLIGLGRYLLAHDKDFAKLFSQSGIQEHTLINALRWIVGTHHREKQQERWWGKDNLSRTTGIGREWAYGTAYTLQKFSRDIRTTAVFSTLTSNPNFAEEKIIEIESILARSQGANVLLVGEPGVGKIDLVIEVQKRMARGQSLDAIAGKHIYVLDTNRLFAVHQNKSSLEQTLLHLFDEALIAGNTIVVIENLSTFIREAQQVGVFIPELLDEYLAVTELHVIATDTPGNFHQFLEPLGGFMRRFAEVLIESPDQSTNVRLLENIALSTELKQKVIFTYESLVAIATAADRYIVEGVMPDKAIDLLIEIATVARGKEQILITADFVYQIVSDKTQVPAGPIRDDERTLLLNLEDTLHQQVVGQQRALQAIARTMRRARAGIQSAERPIGSFLFLGPTGVGKTETAKALAKVFFGSETKLERLDMSEFSGPEALSRLLGDGEHSGFLSDILHEHPYCVLLLDEFEKADQEVHDLFLQILDEGNFTDARGTKINARNTVIIATSNAGAALILRTVQQRQELNKLTEEIINQIIKEGIFKPELINRFDSTIIFEPLTITQQGEVASLMLCDLHTRIKERGYQLEVGRDLMDLLVEKGYDPEFGARPMQRVIQDIVEEKVAKKIIAGEVKKGDIIKLSIADFSDEELQT